MFLPLWQHPMANIKNTGIFSLRYYDGLIIYSYTVCSPFHLCHVCWIDYMDLIPIKAITLPYNFCHYKFANHNKLNYAYYMVTTRWKPVNIIPICISIFRNISCLIFPLQIVKRLGDGVYIEFLLANISERCGMIVSFYQ